FIGSYTNAVQLTNGANEISGQFTGNGAALTALNANAISSGTLGGARLGGSYTNALSMTNAGNVFAGNGAGLKALDADNIASGVLSIARGGTGASSAAA